MMGAAGTTSSVAEQLLRDGRYPEAVEAYRQAIADHPEDAALVEGAGEAYDKLGESSAAKASFQRALELEPNNAELHFKLATTLAHEGATADAEASYRRAIALRPDFVKAHAHLGYLLDGLGRKDEARAEYAWVERAYQEAATTTPSDDPDVWADFGRVLTACDRPDDATRAYARAAGLYKKLSLIHI